MSAPAKTLTIAEFARLVAEIVGYRGDVEFDTTRPDGTPRKLLDVSRINALGWRATTPLREGLKRMYEDFLARYETIRADPEHDRKVTFQPSRLGRS